MFMIAVDFVRIVTVFALPSMHFKMLACPAFRRSDWAREAVYGVFIETNNSIVTTSAAMDSSLHSCACIWHIEKNVSLHRVPASALVKVSVIRIC